MPRKSGCGAALLNSVVFEWEGVPRYSFALADGVRWMPKQAIPLFEATLTAANDDAKKLLTWRVV